MWKYKSPSKLLLVMVIYHSNKNFNYERVLSATWVYFYVEMCGTVEHMVLTVTTFRESFHKTVCPGTDILH